MWGLGLHENQFEIIYTSHTPFFIFIPLMKAEIVNCPHTWGGGRQCGGGVNIIINLK